MLPNSVGSIPSLSMCGGETRLALANQPLARAHSTSVRGLLGDSVHQLGQTEYAVTQNGNKTEVHVSWEEGVLIKHKPTVDTATPLLLDFTWKAPAKEDIYKNGAGLKVGAVINNNKVFDNGTPIVVKKGAKPAGSGASGSSISGS